VVLKVVITIFIGWEIYINADFFGLKIFPRLIQVTRDGRVDIRGDERGDRLSPLFLETP